MKALHLSLAAVALATSVTAAAAAPATGLHWGEARPLGAGTARAWVAVDLDGAPASMGVSIDEKAMASRPRGTAELEALLPLPADVRVGGVEDASTDRAAWARPAFRVRWDRLTRSYVISLDGLAAPERLSATR
jgi:hypothetical protein